MISRNKNKIISFSFDQRLIMLNMNSWLEITSFKNNHDADAESECYRKTQISCQAKNRILKENKLISQQSLLSSCASTTSRTDR